MKANGDTVGISFESRAKKMGELEGKLMNLMGKLMNLTGKLVNLR